MQFPTIHRSQEADPVFWPATPIQDEPATSLVQQTDEDVAPDGHGENSQTDASPANRSSQGTPDSSRLTITIVPDEGAPPLADLVREILSVMRSPGPVVIRIPQSRVIDVTVVLNCFSIIRQSQSMQAAAPRAGSCNINT